MSGIGRAMAGGSKTGERREDDFYPTPHEATEALIGAEFEALYSLLIHHPVWDPACGDGAILKIFDSMQVDTIGTDLHDRGYGESGDQWDFLSLNALSSPVIITNPPFFAAEEFVRKALSFQPQYCAMLLKSTFFHAACRFELFRKHPPTVIYPLTWRLDFLEQGRPTMECAWFVWDASERSVLNTTRYRPLERATPLFQNAFYPGPASEADFKKNYLGEFPPILKGEKP